MGYSTTAKIKEERSTLTAQERAAKERLLEIELAKYGVTRENLDQACEELRAECFARMGKKRKGA